MSRGSRRSMNWRFRPAARSHAVARAIAEPRSAPPRRALAASTPSRRQAAKPDRASLNGSAAGGDVPGRRAAPAAFVQLLMQANSARFQAARRRRSPPRHRGTRVRIRRSPTASPRRVARPRAAAGRRQLSRAVRRARTALAAGGSCRSQARRATTRTSAPVARACAASAQSASASTTERLRPGKIAREDRTIAQPDAQRQLLAQSIYAQRCDGRLASIAFRAR